RSRTPVKNRHGCPLRFLVQAAGSAKRIGKHWPSGNADDRHDPRTDRLPALSSPEGLGLDWAVAAGRVPGLFGAHFRCPLELEAAIKNDEVWNLYCVRSLFLHAIGPKLLWKTSPVYGRQYAIDSAQLSSRNGCSRRPASPLLRRTRESAGRPALPGAHPRARPSPDSGTDTGIRGPERTPGRTL